MAVEGDPGVEPCACVPDLIVVSGTDVAVGPEVGTEAAASLAVPAAGVLDVVRPALAEGVVCTSGTVVVAVLLRWCLPKCCCIYPIARISRGILLRCGHTTTAVAARSKQPTMPTCSARRDLPLLA